MAQSVEAIIRSRRRGAGDDRGHRRQLCISGSTTSGTRSAGPDVGCDEAVARRSRLCDLGRPRPAATTVAATMIAAARAGIHVFATGGIGGVHRRAEETFDISADLEELSRTPRHRRLRRRQGDPRRAEDARSAGNQGRARRHFGRTISPPSGRAVRGLKSPLRLDSAERIAAFQRSREALGIAGGMLIGNPVPEKDEIPAAEMEGLHPPGARRMPSEKGIAGKAVTPFLLSSIY